MSIDLVEEIKKLIYKQKEGSHWDFKQSYNNKAVDLVHDIICLANCPFYSGERYLIFGVDDNYNIVGLSENNNLVQAKVINTLKNARFAGGVFPDISVEKIKIESKDIKVIVIPDKPQERPYYLEAQYPKLADKNRTIHAGTIYNRIRDTNTAINEVASTVAIEKMWRQRFGIDLPPKQRMLQYLLNFNGWSQIGEDKECYYYTEFPEFTIQKPAEPCNEVRALESWVRFALAPNSYVYKVEFRYHQTPLHVEAVLSYDDWRSYYPEPENTEALRKFGDIVLYYYLNENNFKFNYLQFLQRRHLSHINQFNQGREGLLPLLIFKDKNEKDQFVSYLCESFSHKDIEAIEVRDDFKSDSKEKDINQMKLCKFAFDKCLEWRKTSVFN
jgi:hypothetical protein